MDREFDGKEGVAVHMLIFPEGVKIEKSKLLNSMKIFFLFSFMQRCT